MGTPRSFRGGRTGSVAGLILRLGPGLAAVALGGPAGCAGGPLVPALRADARGGSVRADWDDVEAAVDVALSESELAVVRRSGDDPGAERTYQLKSARDEPGWLVVTRERGGPDGEDVAIRMRCTIGRFGDAAREGRFIRSIERRLDQLHGVDSAPR